MFNLTKIRNKKWYLSFYWFVLLLLTASVSTVLYTFWLQSLRIERSFLYSTHAYYAAETGIEKGLYELKINPDEDSFIGQKETISKARDQRTVEYRDQYFYRLERIIEEFIPAGENIQLFFDNTLNTNITKFHIAYLKAKQDPKAKVTALSQCTTPETNASVEIWVFSSTRDTGNPDSLTTILSSINNRCESWFGSSSKSSSNTITDPYSGNLWKISISGWRCLLNNKGNVAGWATVFENNIPYTISNNKCAVSDAGSNEKFYKTDEEVFNVIKTGYQSWTTIIDGLDVPATVTKDSDRVVLEIRAVDNDTYVAIWATDDQGNAYDIPWRYLHFTATGKASWLDGKENDIYRRLIVKRKLNKDLLPIFDYTLFSESEFIK